MLGSPPFPDAEMGEASGSTSEPMLRKNDWQRFGETGVYRDVPFTVLFGLQLLLVVVIALANGLSLPHADSSPAGAIWRSRQMMMVLAVSTLVAGLLSAAWLALLRSGARELIWVGAIGGCLLSVINGVWLLVQVNPRSRPIPTTHNHNPLPPPPSPTRRLRPRAPPARRATPRASPWAWRAWCWAWAASPSSCSTETASSSRRSSSTRWRSSLGSIPPPSTSRWSAPPCSSPGCSSGSPPCRTRRSAPPKASSSSSSSSPLSGPRRRAPHGSRPSRPRRPHPR